MLWNGERGVGVGWNGERGVDMGCNGVRGMDEGWYGERVWVELGDWCRVEWVEGHGVEWREGVGGTGRLV